MLIESDIFIAYIKKEDRLKNAATAIIDAVENGKLTPAQASNRNFPRALFVFSDYEPLQIIIANEARIATIKNLTYITPDYPPTSLL